MKYGLIGKDVRNSFSKQIHESLGYEYELCSLNEEELERFLEKKEFQGINVTIPYKETVLKYLNFSSSSVKSIGTCNCIVNEEGLLSGYNTDYDGIKYMLEKNKFSIFKKNVLVLGSGGTCKTVCAVLKDLKASKIYVVSRTPNKDQLSYNEAQKVDANFIINTTPNGMIGYSDELLLDLTKFKSLEGVADVIYNPLRTRLLQEAKRLNVPYCNGLDMLVYQAVKASMLFNKKEISEDTINKIIFDLKLSKINLVLIGLPGVGKTTLGKVLSEVFNKEFVDLDSLIVLKENRSINEIFSKDGEAYFRKVEKEICTEISGKNNLIISTGGGIILDKENIINLSKNGLVIFLDRDINNFIISDDRPLTKSKEDLEKLYKDRYELYLSSCDVIVNLSNDINSDIEVIKEHVYEIINR